MSNVKEKKYWRFISNSSETTSTRERKLNTEWNHFLRLKIRIVRICLLGGTARHKNCFEWIDSQHRFRWENRIWRSKSYRNQSREIEITTKDVRHAEKEKEICEEKARKCEGERRGRDQWWKSFNRNKMCEKNHQIYLNDSWHICKREIRGNHKCEWQKHSFGFAFVTAHYESWWCAMCVVIFPEKNTFCFIHSVEVVFVRWRTNQSTI